MMIGWILHVYYSSWRYGGRRKEIEVLNTALANQIVAEEAIEMLSEEEKAELEEELIERGNRSFIGDVDVNINPDGRDIDSE